MARVNRATSGGQDRDRAVSTVVGYALNIAVATVLLSVLLVASGGLVEDQRDRVAEAELSVVGERLASDLMSADRLATTDATTVTVRSQLPAQVAGENYRIEVDGNVLKLRTSALRDPVRVPVPLNSSVTATTVRGGDVVIELEGNTLEVRAE